MRLIALSVSKWVDGKDSPGGCEPVDIAALPIIGRRLHVAWEKYYRESLARVLIADGIAA